MDRLTYPQDPSTAPDPTTHDNTPARYIYEPSQHQLGSSAPSNPLHPSPPPTASSAAMSLPAHSSPYFHDSWAGYPTTPSVTHLEPPRRPTTTSDPALTRPKSLHSDTEPPESDISNQVFNHIPQSYSQRIASQHSHEASYHHPLPSSYRPHLASIPPYSELPSTSTPPGTGSVRAPSPTNSAESSSVVGRPPTRHTAPLSLPELPYTPSVDMTGYPSLVRLPVNTQPHWMNLETHQPGYNGVLIDPALRPSEGDFLPHPSTHPNSILLREPSASPEPDCSSPSLHADFTHGVENQRPRSARSSPASAHQSHSNGGRSHIVNSSNMPRVSSPLSSYQYPMSPSYSHPHTQHSLQSYQYPAYRNEAPVYPLNIPSHPQVLQSTPAGYPYPTVANSEPAPSRPTGPSPVAEGTGNAGPGSSAPTAAASNQITNPTRSNSKTKTKLTDMDRKFICVFAASHPKARQEDIATKFAVERSTVSKILKCKDKWMKVDFFSSEARTVKHRPSKFPEIESELIHHIRLKLATREPINDSFIKKTALALADERGIGRDKFKASSGWVENFKHRHDIRRGGVFSSGDRPGAIPIPGAVLSVPGNGELELVTTTRIGRSLIGSLRPGGSLPADGSSGMIIGTPTDGMTANTYNGYNSMPQQLDDGLHYNGENDGVFETHRHGSDSVLTATAQERHGTIGFSQHRTGMKTRSMRSDSLASQRRSTVSSSDMEQDERIPHQDFVSADIDLARGHGYFDRPSSSSGHIHNPALSGHSRSNRQDEAPHDRYLPHSSEYPQSSTATSFDLQSTSGSPHVGDPLSPPSAPALSRSGSANSMSVHHPVVTPSPTAQMVASPTSIASHLPGSPIGSPVLGDLNDHSPNPRAISTHRSMSAPFGSSPLSQHVGTPNSSTSMVALPSCGSFQTHSHIAPSSPKSSVQIHGNSRSYNRRSVTFSEFSQSGVTGQERCSSAFNFLGERRYESGSPQTEHAQPTHSSPGPFQSLARSSRRSASFSTEGTHTLDLSTASNHGNSSFLASNSNLLSSGYPPEMNSFAIDHGRYAHNLKVVGEPLIAEYGYEEPSHEGRITSDAEMLIGRFHEGKDALNPTGMVPTTLVLDS